MPEHVYCLVCGTGRETPQLKISLLKNIFINLVFSQMVFWLLLLFSDFGNAFATSVVVFSLGFLVYEAAHYIQFRGELKCPVCQFDLGRYKRLASEDRKSYLQRLMEDGQSTWKRWYQILNQSLEPGVKE